MTPASATTLPSVLPLGLSGWLVRFADRLDDGANRAALAFRAAVEAEAWPEVVETSLALGSVYVACAPHNGDPGALDARLSALVASRDWFAADLPTGRRLWTIPAAFGGSAGPELAEAADLARSSDDAAIAAFTARPLRILTLGFAPGMPYLGMLPGVWDIPRRSGLTDRVPTGALAVAVRQVVMFPAAMPTGWRQVGRTAFRAFRPDSATPVPLRPGDEIRFTAITHDQLAEIAATDRSGDGGAHIEDMP